MCLEQLIRHTALFLHTASIFLLQPSKPWVPAYTNEGLGNFFAYAAARSVFGSVCFEDTYDTLTESDPLTRCIYDALFQ